jgi:hypothetical protein
MCGVVFMSLLAAAITPAKSGAGAAPVLKARTEDELRATASHSNHFSRRLHCNNGTIHGRYAIKTDGALVGLGPFSAVGVITFDFSGTLTNASTTSTNGNIVSGVTAGTYSINDDCTGQMNFPSVAGPPLSFNVVVADRGDEIYFIATRAPAVLSGVGKRID